MIETKIEKLFKERKYEELIWHYEDNPPSHYNILDVVKKLEVIANEYLNLTRETPDDDTLIVLGDMIRKYFTPRPRISSNLVSTGVSLAYGIYDMVIDRDQLKEDERYWWMVVMGGEDKLIGFNHS